MEPALFSGSTSAICALSVEKRRLRVSAMKGATADVMAPGKHSS